MAHYKHKALQNGDEHEHFRKLLVREKVRSYLEIGSFCGGSLWKCAMVMPAGSRLVSVDLPGTKPEPTQPLLEACVADLKSRGYDTHLFLGNSRDEKIIESVRALGPFDCCFIDANHTLPYVTSDFENYGAMARIVAFHDISWNHGHTARPGGLPIEVPGFWKSIKDDYRHEEIRLDPKTKDNGIGVLWR